MIINDIIKRIKQAKSILIITHISPDGDTTGSALAFALALSKLKINIKVAIEKVPHKYDFMPGQQFVTEIKSLDYSEFDLAIVLDTSSVDRVCIDLNMLKGTDVINIDHHISNTKYGTYNYINHISAATGEIVYQFIQQMDVAIDLDMAVCLYTALATDTGGFKYKNTTSITHEVAGDLINRGIDVARISQLIFDRRTTKEIRLISRALQTLNLYQNNKIAVISVHKKVLDELSATPEECETLINYARDIEGVLVALVLREDEKDKIKVSFRANGNADVSKIAGMFGGGGHTKAAGCTIHESIDAALEKVLQVLKQEIGE